MASSDERALIDELALELLERRLADRLVADVRGKLVQRYTLAGVAVAGLLTVIGFNIFETAKQEASKRILEQVEQPLQERLGRMTEMDRRVQSNFGTMDALTERQTKIFDALEEKLNAFSPKLAQLQGLIERVQDVDLRSQGLDKRSRELDGQLQAVSQGISNVGDLGNRVSELAMQLAELNALVKSRDPTGDQSKYAQIESGLTNLSSSTTQIAIQAQQSTAQADTRVWLQYAVVATDKAQAVADALKNKGFAVPGKERVTTAAGLHEIRYYWAEDRIRAERLSKALMEIAPILGPLPAAKISDFTSWPSIKPKAGTIELWLGRDASAGASGTK